MVTDPFAYLVSYSVVCTDIFMILSFVILEL